MSNGFCYFDYFSIILILIPPDKADAIRKQKQMVELLTSEMKTWIETTNFRINGEVLSPEAHKIKQAKSQQGYYLADLIKFEGKFEGNLDSIDI